MPQRKNLYVQLHCSRPVVDGSKHSHAEGLVVRVSVVGAVVASERCVSGYMGVGGAFRLCHHGVALANICSCQPPPRRNCDSWRLPLVHASRAAVLSIARSSVKLLARPFVIRFVFS
jgi:hypothetical protein